MKRRVVDVATFVRRWRPCAPKHRPRPDRFGSITLALCIAGNLVLALASAPHVEANEPPEDSYEALVERGHWPQALETAKGNAEAAKREHGEQSVEYAAALRDLGAAYNLMSLADEAERTLEQALAIQRDALGPDHPEVATTLLERAWAARGQDQHDQAVAFADASREIRRATFGEDSAEYGESLYYYVMVRVLSSTPFTEQEELAREMVALREKLHGPESLEAASALIVLQGLLRALGEYEEALMLARRFSTIRRSKLGAEHPLVADAHIGLAATLWARGENAEAEELIRSGLAIKRRMLGEDSHAAFYAHAFLATVLTSVGKTEEALEANREAVECARLLYGGAHGNLAAVLNNYGLQLYYAARFEEAEPVLREALDMRKSLNLRPGFARRNLACVLMETGKLDAAGALLELDVDARIADQGESVSSVHMARAFLSTVAGLQGKWQEAETLASLAARSYETGRLKVGRGVERATYKTSPYATLAIAQANLGRGNEAWASIEKARGRVLFDMRKRAALLSLSVEERDQQHELRSKLVEQSDVVARARRDSASTPEAVVAAENALLVARNAWDAFQRQLDEGHALPTRPSVDLVSIQRVLAPGQAIVGWVENPLVLGRSAVWGYVVRSSGAVDWRHMFDATRSALSEFHEALRREVLPSEQSALGPILDEVDRGTTSQLWQERFAPLLDLLDGVGHLIIVPSARTAGLPLELATDASGALLSEHFLVTYAPSATIYAQLNQTSRAAPQHARRGLVVSDPPTRPEHLVAEAPGELDVAFAQVEPSVVRSALDGDRASIGMLPRLWWSQREATAIVGDYPQSSMLTGAEASAGKLREMASRGALREYDFLHFATHALIDPASPDECAVVLSQVGDDDRVLTGLLTGEEISRDWSLDAELVTLSACETALGRNVGGEGIVGLAYPFLQVGARCLLLTLWNVDDRATALLMERFYDNWSNGMSKAEALQSAKRWLRGHTDGDGWRPYQHPYYWAAFILYGDAS